VSGADHHPDVRGKDERVSIGVGRACVVTIWGFVILGYITCYVVEQYYGYAMYYGMIVFLVPAIIVTILFVIGATTSWLLKHRSGPQVLDE
jgi:hypothetical protein